MGVGDDLAVSAQMLREARKFGVPAKIVRSQAECEPGVNITNYQKLPHFDVSKFAGVILDEASILKSVDGHYKAMLIAECASVPFRLSATATPAPNDFMELGNQAEFLGVMSHTDMLATFFAHDGGETQKWRLKGHAENEFWRWLASWAVMLRKPSDLGYGDEGYDLPPLSRFQHVVASDRPSNGMLFALPAETLQERIAARRDTVTDRVAKAVSIVTDDFRVKLAAWKSEADGSLNTRMLDAQSASLTQNTTLVSNLSEAELQKRTANICGSTMPPTNTNGANEALISKLSTTPIGESDTLPTPNTPSAFGNKQRSVQKSAEEKPSKHTDSLTSNTPSFSLTNPVFAPSVVEPPDRTISDGSPLITAMKPGLSEGFCVPTAIEGWGSLTITEIASIVRLNISLRPILDRWVIWCQLNSEQDALKRAFGSLCFSVTGSDTEEEKEAAILAWLNGDRPILLSKPTILGFGLNFQCCNQTIFVGLNDSFEQVYQAMRRFWRFGQTKPVNAHFISAEVEGAVMANLARKETDAERMAAGMVMHTADLSSMAVRGSVRETPDYNPQTPMIIPAWLEQVA